VIPRTRRFDLTPLLDVLLIVFFAVILRLATTEGATFSSASASDSEAALAADSEAGSAAARRSDEPDGSDDQQASLEASLSAARGEARERAHDVDRMTARLDEMERLLETAELYASLDTAAGGVLQELLEDRLVIVSLYLRDNQVAEYQRFGAASRTRLRQPVPLVELRRDESLPDGQAARTIGDFFPRLFEVLDASLVQREGSSHIFYLVVPEGENICEAFWGLARDVRRAPRLQVIMPVQDCPEDPVR
jgi:hypothetical protein